MQAALTKLLIERERLRARSERQRAAIALACDKLARPAALVDRGIEGVRFLKSHPLAVGAIVAVVALARVRFVLAVAVRGIGLWRFARRVRGFAHLIGI